MNKEQKAELQLEVCNLIFGRLEDSSVLESDKLKELITNEINIALDELGSAIEIEEEWLEEEDEEDND